MCAPCFPSIVHGVILESLRKTNRILFLDEDCPGGATAYMMQKVIEEQNGYHWLDCAPRTLAAKEHRPAYGSDGDYFSKPNREQIFEAVYEIMHEANPTRFPEVCVSGSSAHAYVSNSFSVDQGCSLDAFVCG